MNECPECYSDKPRITPLIDAAHCLKDHKQYICNTCGRAICIDKGINNKYRVKLPFKTLEIAKYYLRAAEILHRSGCEIYELEDDAQRIFFLIVKDRNGLNEYLEQKKRNFKLREQEPVFKSPTFHAFLPNQCRNLNSAEVKTYLDQRRRPFTHD
jgi:hypothetical protein